jgi:uncharacterized phiE125 gp8 family phage protein
MVSRGLSARNVVITSPPATEPVSTAEAKEHLRVMHSHEDGYIRSLIPVARRRVETFTRRQLITAGITLTLDRFPLADWEPIQVPRPPLISITSINYLAEDGTLTLWPASSYQVDALGEPGRILPEPNEVYPITEDDRLNAVTILYQAGFGTNRSDVPNLINQAILLTLSELFERREEAIAGTIIGKVPLDAQNLLWGFRKFRFK